MPGMHMFGRRWAVATDDFVFPALTEAVLRFLWFVITVAIFTSHKEESCTMAGRLNLFIITSFVYNLILVVYCMHLAYASSRGGVLNCMVRTGVVKILSCRFPLAVLEACWAIVGAVWLSQADQTGTCDWSFLFLIRFAVYGCWFLLGLMLVSLLLVFDPLGHFHYGDLRLVDHAQKVWRRRFQTIFCCFGRNDRIKVAFEDTAELLSSLFGDVDLVLTDIWAGLILLADERNNLLRIRELKTEPVVPLPDWMNVEQMLRFAQFAVGVYGWPYFVCSSAYSIRPLCSLVRRLSCFHRCRCDSTLVMQDNCCLCNTSAFLLQTGLVETDLFYVNFHNEVWETPFVACIDHRTRSVVVAIRGSSSFRDAFTDLCLNEDCLQLDAADSYQSCTGTDTNTVLVHRGILRTARYVHQKLTAENVLEDLFVLQPDYELVLTGHSLGAGVAVVVAMLLRPKYPKLRCFAYSPPGCVIDRTSLAYTKQFVCSVIVGDDLVPRLSFQSLTELKAALIEVLQCSSRPKFDILVKGIFRWAFAPRSTVRRTVLVDDQEAIVGYDATFKSSDETDQQQQQQQRQDQDREFEEETDPSQPLIANTIRSSTVINNDTAGDLERAICRTSLCCPGRILHLPSVTNAAAQVEEYDVDALKEIRLTSSMLADHMPHSILAALRAVVARQNL
ncbi:Sn1-specific diacylglycerol lipase beta [Trichinella pseudospiralis]|uniref:sn-1-specific diacylglycerol lipase n=1 Tax=Trichinella pseudospiralis TaxID=6337 RepID=A0A0V1G3W4_TRIPS|nr:Sn1-specific diacylglycerol lipase beta [Trichinella pseudospiralis]